MAYRASLNRKDHMAAAAMTVAVCAAMVSWLIWGLNVDTLKKVSDYMKVVNIDAPPPPEPPSIPAEVPYQKAASKAGAPNITSKAASIVAPKAVIPPQTPTVPAAPIAGSGSEHQSGATPTLGAGTGAAGQGHGTGAGGSGMGTGGGTRPVWQSGTIQDRDYPRSSSSAQRGGEVEARFTITPTGRVTSCRVTKSSGDSDLDQITCKLIEQRFRFRPATNAAGEAISSTYGWRQSWWLERRR
ncbi:energy transducer TonB [Sphingopyxis yananensis]|uniref:energy transducer TonB n=1 Tax=Sphingopyxis yananensis TaxID=2886687 RepID=UPI001D0F69A0|nr:energy transducer TonB [Sphingopyxis yananensis]MCC2600962.1 energy transducer TonB [Sphingopyxis yananensis]